MIKSIMTKSIMPKPSKKRGKFITLEGMDGAGKSTHIPNIIAALMVRGLEVVSTREPGGTKLGEALRALLLHDDMHPEVTKALYFVGKGDGTHAFSNSLIEHNANVVKYQLKKSTKKVSQK